MLIKHYVISDYIFFNIMMLVIATLVNFHLGPLLTLPLVEISSDANKGMMYMDAIMFSLP